MQPYFDPTRKMTSKKNGRRPQKKNEKWKMTSKKMKMEDDLNFKAADLTTKTSKTNGFDTIEIDLV